MVDFRPLLFINALALMLLVTAGFASVRKDLDTTDTTAPALAQTVEHAIAPETSAATAPTTRIEAETPAPEAEEPLFADTRETPLADTPETPQPVDNALPATGEQT
ncbi:MAG: PEGA domain-containing protein, partial [Pseudomonadota bacterium]|nr:PEGA domain-containing protein [Pseudomonadota bacterium]